MIEIKPIENKELWQNFVEHAEPTSILQSWAWREFLYTEKLSPETFFILFKGEPIAAALIAKINLPTGKFYLYCPRGPIFAKGLMPERRDDAITELAAYLKRSHYGQGAIFLRMDPGLNAQEVNLYQADFKKASREVQPRQTIVVNLQESEENILARMKSKTRYNIRLAEKRGVEIKTIRDEKELKDFYNLLRETGQRDNFSIHSYSHYLHLWQALSPEYLKVYLAFYQGELIAGIMVTFFKDMAIYLHGASDYEHRQLMAPHLLQWQAMKDAKHLGCLYYDFWGVAPKNASESHPWSGISRFKFGFGGEYQEYVGTYDYIYSPFWYRMFNTARSLRQMIR